MMTPYAKSVLLIAVLVSACGADQQKEGRGSHVADLLDALVPRHEAQEEGRGSHVAGLLDALVHRHETVANFGAIVEFPARHMAPRIKRKSDVTLGLEAMSPADALAEIQRLVNSGKRDHAIRLLLAVELRKVVLILASPSPAPKVF